MRGAWIEICYCQSGIGAHKCRSPCGERGLKCAADDHVGGEVRRSPCGERGLKWRSWASCSAASKSLPVRGAWIEIVTRRGRIRKVRSLPVRGAWIEIRKCGRARTLPRGRSPCGERGLKYCHVGKELPACSRSPCGERGLKCCLYSFAALLLQSLPVRGAWIEIIPLACRPLRCCGRSPCGERGLKSAVPTGWRRASQVAPRAGSVD